MALHERDFHYGGLFFVVLAIKLNAKIHIDTIVKSGRIMEKGGAKMNDKFNIEKRLRINFIIDNICDSSIKVDNFKAYKENNGLVAEFSKNGKIFISKTPIEEIVHEIAVNNIADNDINDYIIFNIMRKNLVEKVVDNAITETKNDIDNILNIQKLVNNFIDKVFSD